VKLNEVYGGNYLKAEDLKDRGEVRCVIESVSVMEGDDGKKKAVLHFRGKEKTLPLNITNANMVSELYGDETDDWEGQAITLYTCKVDFQGKRVLAIRIKEPATNSNGTRRAVAPPPPPPPSDISGDLTDDDIPF
jgi:hypothetical protein